MIPARVPIQRPADARLLVVDSEGKSEICSDPVSRPYSTRVTSSSQTTQRRCQLAFLEFISARAGLSR